MGTILEDVRSSADWIAEALSTSGYKADFSPESLWEIDRFFDEHSRDGEAIPGGLLSESLGSRLFALGSYVGEVARRHLGGTWHGDDADQRAEINVELHLPDGTTCWPVLRVMKRFKNGPEDGIAAYGAAMGLAVGGGRTQGAGDVDRWGEATGPDAPPGEPLPRLLAGSWRLILATLACFVFGGLVLAIPLLGIDAGKPWYFWAAMAAIAAIAGSFMCYLLCPLGRRPE